MTKPTLCLDFDGVIHSYTSGWKGADNATDPPTPGAMEFLVRCHDVFKLVVYSSRSNSVGGIWCMRRYITDHLREYLGSDRTLADDILAEIEYARSKPSAFLTLDDRALTFTGTWPKIEDMLAFKPWNK